MKSFEPKIYSDSVKALYEIFKRDDAVKFLTADERQLLIESKTDQELIDAQNTRPPSVGYPATPLISHLAHFLCLIMETGTCPTWDMPGFANFDEGKTPQQRRESILWVRDQLQGAVQLWDHWNDKEKQQLFIRVLRRLRRRGLLDMFILRRTVGSADVLPIPRHRLLEACNELHTQEEPKTKALRSVLTVCGRAIAKHTVRDSSNWWGVCTGTEEDKNRLGLHVMNKIMDNAIWINIHELPGKIKNLEFRTAEGYGARFDYQPLRFRGFLEPYQLEGWVNRYKH